MSDPMDHAGFKPVVILPTYNNEKTLPDILRRLEPLGLPAIAINDGATDSTPTILEQWRAAAPSATVLTHPVNKGKAAAMQTGFAAAAAAGFTHAVTIDTDGQLDPEQIPELLAVAAAEPRALVLGDRDDSRPDYPSRSRLGRRLSNYFIRLECGRKVSDSQCGFRVYPLSLIAAAPCRAGRFGWEAEIITRAAWAGHPLREVPVACRYQSGGDRVTHFKVGRDTLLNVWLHLSLLFGRLVSPPARRAAAAPSAPPPQSNTPSQLEWLLAFGLLAAGMLLRVIYINHYRIDSDEPQHLHVVWGWSRGLLQYRDVFDNHTPLFHMLMSPLVRLFGERANLLVKMRTAMIPFYLTTLFGTFVIAWNLFSMRIGLWTAVIVGLLHGFFVGSVEFRTDDLWAMFFVLSLAALFVRDLTPPRGFIGGLLMGATISTSMKTSVLLACLASALLIAAPMLARSQPQWRPFARRNFSVIGSVLAGFLVVPLLIIAYFWLRGALPNLYYGVIQHNIVPSMGHFKDPAARYRDFCLLAAGLILFARFVVVPFAPFGALTPAYVILLLMAGFYQGVIRFLWPLVTQQDFLPLWPVVGVLAAPWLIWPTPGLAAHRRLIPLIFLVVAVIAAIIGFNKHAESVLAAQARFTFCAFTVTFLMSLIFMLRPRLNLAFVLFFLLALAELNQLGLPYGPRGPYPWQWRDVTSRKAIWKAVLDLTGPNDFVLDPKGEMIFRKRPFYWALEGITLNRLGRHMIHEDFVKCIATAHPRVVYPLEHWRFPGDVRRYIDSNYVNVGPVMVAGQKLDSKPPKPGAPIPFTVNIPENYDVVSRSGPGRGQLDGEDMCKGKFLSAGRHTYQPADGETSLVLVWTNAIDHGYHYTPPKPRIPRNARS